MRQFYGVYLECERLSNSLDLIRFLGEPGFYRRCHITLRGPYDRPISPFTVSRINQILTITNHEVLIDRPSIFLTKFQNTIALRCDFPGIDEILHKPDFSDSYPHITLYDGNSNAFATELYGLVSKYDWRQTAKISNLMTIEKKSHFSERLPLYFDGIFETSRMIFGHSFDLKQVENLNPTQRLEGVRRVCQYLFSHKKQIRW